VPVKVGVAVTVGVAGTPVAVAVGVTHVQQAVTSSHWRMSPGSQVSGFCVHCPQADALQKGRIVGHG
jgi:hypothetical protein